MSLGLAGCDSAHASAFIRTRLSRPEQPPITIFISGIKPRTQALVGRYSVHATAFICTILSLPEPLLLY